MKLTQKQTALSLSKDHAGKIVALTFLFTTTLSYTLLGDTHPLPSIALHSTFVFHLERALIISGICYLLWIIFVYTSEGRVPTQIGTTGIGYSHNITGAIRETSEENTELAVDFLLVVNGEDSFRLMPVGVPAS